MKTKTNIHIFLIASLIVVIGLTQSCKTESKISGYEGKRYSDSLYKSGAQSIPGKLQCEYYDFGGEGIAFHDSDSINSGSGRLNPANGTYLHEFRINEAVDISYTKTGGVDDNGYNFKEPILGQLYLGWTNPGEWTKYTVDVSQTGKYKLGIMYTSNQNGKISLSVNDKDMTGPLLITSTFIEADSIPWRQWHHWNYIDSLGTIELDKGIQTLTINTVEIGQMNYDFINFELIK